VSGVGIAGGVHIRINVSLQLVGWSWKEEGPITVIPQPSEVTAKLTGRELALGFAIPAAASAFKPPDHAFEQPLYLTLPLTTQALSELEAARDGGPLELTVALVAHALHLAAYPDFPRGVDASLLLTKYTFEVSRDSWIGVLESVGYADTLITELRLPTDGVEATALSRRRLAEATTARNFGAYADAMRRCRMAVEELEKKGFGGKAPSEVVAFIKGNARKLSTVERLSALQTALELFLSPAHHSNAPEDSYTREDADLSIAMTAALLRLWPMRVDDTPETS
jgi:hypothetical protein